MKFEFKEVSVLITGAGSGIGRGLALGFMQAGANVIASDLSLERLIRLQKEAEDLGKSILIRQADVSNEDEVSRLFTIGTLGIGIDVFVHSAGISIKKTLTETTHDEYRKLIETNITGTFNCLQSAVAALKSTGKGGSIITISSINTQWPLANQAVYTATKSAIESMSKALAVEAATWKIRVNSIAPGAIDTPLNERLQGERRVALSNRIPLGRIGIPDDIVGAAFYLASPLSSYVTGSTITVDGGFIVSR